MPKDDVPSEYHSYYRWYTSLVALLCRLSQGLDTPWLHLLQALHPGPTVPWVSRRKWERSDSSFSATKFAHFSSNPRHISGLQQIHHTNRQIQLSDWKIETMGWFNEHRLTWSLPNIRQHRFPTHSSTRSGFLSSSSAKPGPGTTGQQRPH